MLRPNSRLIGSHHHKELQMRQWRLKTHARKSSELSPIIIILLVQDTSSCVENIESRAQQADLCDVYYVFGLDSDPSWKKFNSEQINAPG